MSDGLSLPQAQQYTSIASFLRYPHIHYPFRPSTRQQMNHYYVFLSTKETGAVVQRSYYCAEALPLQLH
jgi:hypothetical protein